jgi:hypothetical protein
VCLPEGERKFGVFESASDSTMLLARWPHLQHFCFVFDIFVFVKVVCSDAVEIVRPRDFIEDTIPAREVSENSPGDCWRGEKLKPYLDCKLSPKIEDNLPLSKFGVNVFSSLSANVKALFLLTPQKVLVTGFGVIFTSLFST